MLYTSLLTYGFALITNLYPSQMGEQRDKALKELRDQLAAKKQSATMSAEEQNFWETSGFKIVVSMSMLILVVFSKR